jgi:acetoin utilization deacetylase AcuC-like enzyme
MDFIYNSIFLTHNPPAGNKHPENKSRLECLGKLSETKIESGEPYIELVHSKEHIATVKDACLLEQYLDADTYTSRDSYKAAMYSAGAAIMASECNGFALGRPPGHHAHAGYSSGFCLFNNIAIAVMKLVNEGKRIFILDFDGHLGDGTEDIFYDTEKVFFWSLHQYPAFPGGGYVDETGKGKGLGFTMNVPLPAGSADDIFLHAITNLMTVAEQFNPDVVAVSAGFDAHINDPLLELNVSESAFYTIGELLTYKFKNIFAVLEGGYNTLALPKCILNFKAGINKIPIPYPSKSTISAQNVRKEYEKRMEELVKNMRNYWKF